MKSRFIALLLVSALLPAFPPAARAQTDNSAKSATTTDAQDWQELQSLKPGKKILVEFKTNIGDPIEGKFVSVVGTKLTLTRDDYTYSLEQRDIRSVYQLKGVWSRGAVGRIGAVIGALVGGSVGTGIALRHEAGSTEANTAPTMAGLLVGGLVGYGLGRLAGGKRKGKLLYEAK